MATKKHSKKNIRGHWKCPPKHLFLGAMRGAEKDIEYGMGSTKVTEGCRGAKKVNVSNRWKL